MGNKLSPEKWPNYGGAATIWWDALSSDDKRKYKLHFEKIREWNAKRQRPYPNMWDTTDIRVSKLSQKQIYRIWSFKDHPEDKER